MYRKSMVLAALVLCLAASQASAVTTVYSYGGPSVLIPDHNLCGPDYACVSLEVADDFAIDDIDVEIDIEHTWVGDLKISLEGPSGQRVKLANRLGRPATYFGFSTDDFLNTRFDDDAARDIDDATAAEAPFTGTWRPDGSVGDLLSSYNGLSAQGTWTLCVKDRAFGDTGQINGFKLFVSHDGTTQPVPEPKTLALFGLGLIGLVPLARKIHLG